MFTLFRMGRGGRRPPAAIIGAFVALYVVRLAVLSHYRNDTAIYLPLTLAFLAGVVWLRVYSPWGRRHAHGHPTTDPDPTAPPPPPPFGALGAVPPPPPPPGATIEATSSVVDGAPDSPPSQPATGADPPTPLPASEAQGPGTTSPTP